MNSRKAENIYVELTNELIKNVRLQQEEEENAQKGILLFIKKFVKLF